jgi:hypothetical protein
MEIKKKTAELWNCYRRHVESEIATASYLLYQVALLSLFQDLQSQFWKKKIKYWDISSTVIVQTLVYRVKIPKIITHNRNIQ